MGKRTGHVPEMARFHRYVPGRDDRDLPGEEIDLSLGTAGCDLERIVQDDIVAELGAHRTEVARLHRYVPSPGDRNFAGEDISLSLRSDGYVLVRRVLRWRDGDPDRDSWRLHSRIRAATSAERRERAAVVFPKVIRRLAGKGFTLREGPAFFEVRDQGNEDDSTQAEATSVGTPLRLPPRNTAARFTRLPDGPRLGLVNPTKGRRAKRGRPDPHRAPSAGASGDGSGGGED